MHAASACTPSRARCEFWALFASRQYTCLEPAPQQRFSRPKGRAILALTAEFTCEADSASMASSGSATPEAAVLLIPTVLVVVAAALLAPTIKKLIAKKTSSVQLLYFDLPGLGEPIRFLLAHLGVPFEDRRFKAREEFLALKPTLVFGQVPCLKIDGQELFQSSAILRALAQKFDVSGTLYPQDACLASQVDGLIAQVSDMTQGWGPLRYRERFGFPADLFTDAAQAT